MINALGIGGNERSNFILVQSPDEDGNYSTSKEIQQGKQLSYNAVNSDDLLKEKKNPEPIVWLLGLVISYFFTRNISEKNPEGTGKPIITKLDTSGKVKTPEMKLIPPAVPAESSDHVGFSHWRKIFAKFLHAYCMAAWEIWHTEDVKCPVSPTCQEFALYLDEQGFRDQHAEYSKEFFEAREFEWAIKRKDDSTANLNHINALNFLDTMIRRAAKDVPILHHCFERIAVMDIKGLNMEMARYYQTLDDFTKMEAGRAFGLMGPSVGQTLREFYVEEEGVISALADIGCAPTEEMQKHVLLAASYMFYPEKLERATQRWTFNKAMDFPAVRIGIDKILTDDNIDRSFSTTLTSELAKATHSNDRLKALLNMGKVYNAIDTKIYGKKDE